MRLIDTAGSKVHIAAMRIKAAIFVSLSALALLAFADDQLSTLKIDGTTYSNVTVLRVTATDLYFSSSSGICNVKLKSLDPDLQARFAPEAEKAGEIEKKHSRPPRNMNRPCRSNLSRRRPPAIWAQSHPPDRPP